MGEEFTKKCYGDVYTLTHNPEYPPAKYQDFLDFKKMIDDDEGWTMKSNKNGNEVYFREEGNEEILQLKLRSTKLHF